MKKFSRFVVSKYYKWRCKPSNACRFFLCIFITEISEWVAPFHYTKRCCTPDNCLNTIAICSGWIIGKCSTVFFCCISQKSNNYNAKASHRPFTQRSSANPLIPS